MKEGEEANERQQLCKTECMYKFTQKGAQKHCIIERKCVFGSKEGDTCAHEANDGNANAETETETHSHNFGCSKTS